MFLGLEIGATYAKICLGFFQWAAIVILTIQVKQKFSDSIDTISKWLYIGITIWCASIVSGVIIFGCYIERCLSNTEDGT